MKSIYTKWALGLIFNLLILESVQAQMGMPWERVSGFTRRSQPSKIQVRTHSDLQRLQGRRIHLEHSYSLQVHSGVGPNALQHFLNKHPDFSELYLYHVEADSFDVDFFGSLDYIDHLIVHQYMPDSSLMIAMGGAKNIEKLTLIFDQVPDDFDFLYYYQKIQNLHIYGNFLPDDLHNIVDKLKVFHNLEELGLSIDFATDLPRNLNLVTSLRILKLYDNLSRISSENALYVQGEKFNIQGILGNDQATEVSVLFYALGGGLTTREHAYLAGIWSGERSIFMLPTQTQGKEYDLLSRYRSVPAPKFVHPLGPTNLIEGLYPEEQIFEIHSDHNYVLTTQEGGVIHIPAGALVNASGLPHEGNAYVQIRSMSNLLEMAFRGLDLRVTKYPNSPIYRADRCIEIVFSDGVLPLYLNGQVHLKLEMPIEDTASSVYFYDPEVHGFLDYELYKKVQYESAEQWMPIRFHEWAQDANTQYAYQLDNRNFEERFRDPENYYLLDKSEHQQRFIKQGPFYTLPYFEWDRRKHKSKNTTKVRAGTKLVTVKRTKTSKGEKSDVFFGLQDRKSFFNELRPLRRSLFKLSDTLDGREFSKQYTRGSIYHDLRIQSNPREQKMELILKSTEGHRVIRSEATLYKRNGKARSARASQRILNRYNKRLARKESQFNQALDLRLQGYAENIASKQADLIKKDRLPSVLIKKEGIYGFLNIEAAEKTNEINLNLHYLDNNGIAIDVKELYLIEKGSGNVRTLKPGSVYLDFNKVSLLLCVDHKDRLHFLNGMELQGRNLTDGGIFFLRMNTLSNPPRSVLEFYNYIKFDRIKP